MFIAMNRFKVIKEERKAFEDLSVTRRSRLDEVKGFRAFHLLRGPECEDHVLYSSHTIWASQEDFTDWPKSEQFRAAHQHAGERKPFTLGHPGGVNCEVGIHCSAGRIEARSGDEKIRNVVQLAEAGGHALAMIADAHPPLAPHQPHPVRETDEWLWESATEFCAALDRYAGRAMEIKRENRRTSVAPAARRRERWVTSFGVARAGGGAAPRSFRAR